MLPLLPVHRCCTVPLPLQLRVSLASLLQHRIRVSVGNAFDDEMSGALHFLDSFDDPKVFGAYFKKIDTNEDGKIDKAEYVASMDKRLAPSCVSSSM
jgi:hypothetical protein